MKKSTIAAGVLLVASIAPAQESSSFALEEYAFNAGGTPSQGVVPTSTSFSVTLASIGDRAVGTGLSSVSFGMDVGFDAAFSPPGEVAAICGSGPCFAFTDRQTLTWPAEPAAIAYDLYRDDSSDGYGNCEKRHIEGTTTTDPSTPGEAFFYLVTARNRLGEEGTKGFRSDMAERQGSVDLPACP